MNTIGKIFVFLNLVLAVFFMAWATATYAAHKNWRAEITKHKAEYNKKYAEADKLKKERDQLIAQRDADRVARERAMAVAVASLKQHVEQLKLKTASLTEKETSLAAAIQTTTKLQENLKVAVDNETKLNEINKQILADNDARFKKVVKMYDELNTLMAQIPLYQEREKQLAADIGRAQVLLQMLGYTLLDPATMIPPPVDGKVLSIGQLRDPNLIEISMGKDDGLRINHNIDLYRGPNYLGRAVIVETAGNRSVAKVLKDDLRAPLREDDSFTTRLQYLTSQTKK